MTWPSYNENPSRSKAEVDREFLLELLQQMTYEQSQSHENYLLLFIELFDYLHHRKSYLLRNPTFRGLIAERIEEAFTHYGPKEDPTPEEVSLMAYAMTLEGDIREIEMNQGTQ